MIMLPSFVLVVTSPRRVDKANEDYIFHNVPPTMDAAVAVVVPSQLPEMLALWQRMSSCGVPA